MDLIIPFTKDIKFDTNIGEITSISLEHDYTFNEDELLGNFTITGEYKTHEVSINKEPFEYVLPFTVSLSNPIDPDSIELEIKDFTYDIKDNNILTIKIEYEVLGDELESDRTNDEFDMLLDEAMSNVPVEKEIINREDNENDDNVADVIQNTNNNEETFVTYHIHIFKDNETIESICTKYNTNESLIKEYNDISSLSVGDKLIIPDIDE